MKPVRPEKAAIHGGQLRADAPRVDTDGNGFIPQHTAKHQQPASLLCGKHPEIPPPQRLQCPAHSDGFSEEVPQSGVAVVPGHGAAVFFFCCALNAQLVAIEDRGHSHKGHQKKHREIVSGGISAAEGQKTADIVAVQKIQLRRNHLQPVTHPHVGNAPRKIRRVDGLLGKKQLAVLSEVIVHGGVEHIALKPVSGTLPDLADEQGLRVHFLDGPAESPPEAVVHLAGYVQPPSVDAEFRHPVAPHPAEVVLHLRIPGVEFGHHPFVSETGVGWVFLRGSGTLHRKFQVVKPVPVF